MKAFPQVLETGGPGRFEPWPTFLRRRLGALARPAARPTAAPEPLELEPGDLVRVRPLPEVLATLGAGSGRGGCAFATLMARRCGETHRVLRPVERFFDEAQGRMLRARNLVLLEGVTCDGSTFDDLEGCDRGCLFYWRTEWLERIAPPARGAAGRRGSRERERDRVEPSLQEPWAWYALRRLRGLGSRVRHVAAALRGHRARALRAAPLPQAPRLVSGDRVRIRSLAEIRATLDALGRLEDCVFGPGMAELCGREARVDRALASFYDEGPGRIVKAPNLVALEGLRCDGAGHGRPGCDRRCVYFWHTAWLERIGDPPPAARG